MLEIRISSTPNPNARKYILGEEIKSEGKVTYRKKEECTHVPLAHKLMSTPNIKQVHFFENILTITCQGQYSWQDIDEAVQNICEQEVKSHDIFFTEYLTNNNEDRKEKKLLTGELKKIDMILENTIRPSLQMDGGDIELIDLENKILTVRYMGACGDCPSSYTGTLNAIRMTLQQEYSKDLEVVVI